MARPDPFPLRQASARPLAAFASAFLLGLIAAKRFALPAIPCAVALGAAAILGLVLRKRRRLAAALLLVAGLAAGATRMGLAMDSVDLLETRYSVAMTGRVASEPYLNPDTGRLIFKFDLIEADGEPMNARIRLYLRGEAEDLDAVDYGQRLELTGHIWKPDPVTNPFEFDFGAYLLRQGLRGYATAKIEDVQITGVTRDIQTFIIAARRAVSGRIDALFPENAGLMRALTLGDRTLLSEELRESLSRTGTAHLISISGLHVTVLCALLSFVLRRIMSRKWANVLAILLLIPYGALIGFSAPFVRALSMFAIFCFAPIAGVPSDSITRLCAVLLVYLLARPLSIDDAGFVLSYAASAGILLLVPPLMKLTGAEALRRRRPPATRRGRLLHKLKLYFPTLLCASLAAQLTTLPAVVAFFGVQSVISLPFNLVCVPLCMLGYIAGLAALLLSVPLFPLAALLVRLPDGLFSALTAITRSSAVLPASVVRFGRYPAPLVLIHWAIVLAASELSRITIKWRRLLPFSLLAVAGVCSLITFVKAWPFSVTFLDADQADCAVVRSHGRTYLFDAGDTYTPAADYLNATCLKLDGVVLSHPHQDHAGGLTDVLTSFRPDAIYVPTGWFDVEEVSPAVTEAMDLAAQMGVPVIELRAGDSVELSDMAVMDVYSPAGDALPAEVNDMSLLTLVRCEGQGVLFTGDLSVNGEPELLPDCDVLKVAHHGSDKATSARFLAAATPEFAVVSVGENNYGHPSPDTLDKLADIGATVYLTRERGAISMTWRDDAWRIETYLEEPHELE